MYFQKFKKRGDTHARRTGSWRDRPLVRPAELAALTGLSLRTVRRRIASGAIRSHLEGRCRLIPICEIFRIVGKDADAEKYSNRLTDSEVRDAIATVMAKVAKAAR
jgi:excisionase family DNA binding protein